MRFTVFTKPFPTDTIPALGKRIAALGFDGIELPVRPGFPVHPDNAATELPKAVKLLKDEFGLTVDSVASETSERLITACGKAGVRIIRICPTVGASESYPDAERRYQKEWKALLPTLDANGVAIGVQNHSGRCVPVHAMGLLRLLTPFDPKHVCAVWDAAHNALEGEIAPLALDLICGPYLKMVNLKNAYRRRESEGAPWKTHWCRGDEGFASWKTVADELQRRSWHGPVCLTAEYSDEHRVMELIAHDIAYARRLFSGTT